MSDLEIFFNNADKIITYLNSVLVLPVTGDHTQNLKPYVALDV